MSSIFKKPDYRAANGYNGFDMSQRVDFSSGTGMLLPVYYDLLQPGDKITIHADMFTRTMDMASAAFARITEHIDYFFVPLEQLWSLFPSWFYGISDFKSSYINDDGVDNGLSILDLFQVITQMGNKEAFPLVGNYSYINRGQFQVPLSFDAQRLFDLFGYGNMHQVQRDVQSFLAANTGADVQLPIINPLLPAAYHKIYSDYYRLTDRENSLYSIYSLDEAFAVNGFEVYDDLFELHYRPWKKDYFTSAQPTPLFGDSSTPRYQLSAARTQGLFNPNLYVSNFGVNNAAHPLTSTGGTSTGFGSTVGVQLMTNSAENVSPDSIRALFAVDKLLRVTHNSAKTYDAQTLAHFGVKIPDQIAGNVKYLGSQSSRIQIGEVIGTATTENSTLGQISGKGMGYTENNEPIHYETNCHGILMAIYSAVPEACYMNYGLDRLNSISMPNDMYKPEFGDLGMQPLFRYESYLNFRSANNSIVDGWSYRYSQYKSKIDRVHGALSDTLSYWVPTRQKKGEFVRSDLGTVAVSGLYDTPSSQIESYLIPPYFLDDVMLVHYLPTREAYTANDVFGRDPLIHSFDFHCTKASKMSVYGEPHL